MCGDRPPLVLLASAWPVQVAADDAGRADCRLLYGVRCVSAVIMTRRANALDLAYVTSLAKREAEAIGFIPSPVYEAVVTGDGPYARPNNRLWIAEENGERVGFLYASPGPLGGSVKVLQVCVQEDARLLEFGSALVNEAERYATLLQRGAVSLAVAADLEASRFWESEGYTLARIDRGGIRRGRLLERRYKRLACGLFTEATA